MLDFVIFAVSIIIFLVVAVIYLLPSKTRTTTIPGPDPMDNLEGNFPDIAASGSLHEFLTQIHADYGPIASFWWGPQLAVSVASPELFKEQSNIFDRPVELFEMFQDLIGNNSIQLTNGTEGRRRHVAYGKCFNHEAIKQYYSLFHQLSDELIAKWKSFSKEEHISVRPHAFAFAIKTLLQGSYGSTFINPAKVLQLRQAYDFVWSEMEMRLSESVPDRSSSREQAFNEHRDKIRSIVKEVVRDRKKNPPAGTSYLLIDTIIDDDRPEEDKVDDLITVLVAGFHTTGLLLTWAIYFLASHPDIQEKAYKEVCDVLGKTDTVDPDNSASMVYLKQIIKETLRCSILGPYAARVQEVETELGGHTVPAWTPVIHALGVVMQDPTIYPDPDQFDPERFSEENCKGRSTFAFQPFGFAGKRKCLGYRFSEVEALVVLSSLIRNFKIHLVEGQVVTPVFGLVTSPKEDIWITVSKRDPLKLEE